MMKGATLVLAVVPATSMALSTTAPAERPSILWISCEDTSPWLGFCGEGYATTPNLDRLARDGVYYRNAYATAPVCAPTRFAVITGRYATRMGTHWMRSKNAVPDAVEGFPTLLRRAGYYCTNNSKTDYNTSAAPRIIRDSWDECSENAHYRNRKADQPFFAVFNLTETHQSRVFEKTAAPALGEAEKHDPSKAPLPPYYPDTPGARRTIARVQDCITAMDRHAGQILDELEKAGLKEKTIVVFWPDHGQGIPRGKRTLWDTGTRVPMVVWFPEKWRRLAPSGPGTTCDRMVSLMDLGPTMLSIAQVEVPRGLDGEAFLGPAAGEARRYVYTARDRIDEAMEMSRAVRDERFLYIRNYMPHLSWLQPESYSDQLDFRRELGELATAGKLNEEQLTYAGPGKPLEALYDSAGDPWQMKNLALDPAQRATLERMRGALAAWQEQRRDLGFIPEWEAQRLSAGGRALVEAASGEDVYPLKRVMETARMVGASGKVDELSRRLADANAVVRYWAAVGLRAAPEGVGAAKAALTKAMGDESMPVRIESAGALVAKFDDPAALAELARIAATQDAVAAHHAARTLEMLGEKARGLMGEMEKAAPAAPPLAKWSLEAAVKKLKGDESGPAARGRGRRRRAATTLAQ